MIYPIYDENIVVAVVSNQHFDWYVSNKFLWILDLAKLNSIEYKNYCSNSELMQIRENLTTITKENSHAFLDKMQKFRVMTRELKDAQDMQNDAELEALSPALYVDFDNCILYSQFPEYLSFEDYVPNNWSAHFEDFISKIPHENIYWN